MFNFYVEKKANVFLLRTLLFTKLWLSVCVGEHYTAVCLSDTLWLSVLLTQCVLLKLWGCWSFWHMGLCAFLTVWDFLSFWHWGTVCPFYTVRLCVLLTLWGCVILTLLGLCPLDTVGQRVILTLWCCMSFLHCGAVCPSDTVGLCILFDTMGQRFFSDKFGICYHLTLWGCVSSW